jgi:hypothetical protein
VDDVHPKQLLVKSAGRCDILNREHQVIKIVNIHKTALTKRIQCGTERLSLCGSSLIVNCNEWQQHNCQPLACFLVFCAPPCDERSSLTLLGKRERMGMKLPGLSRRNCSACHPLQVWMENEFIPSSSRLASASTFLLFAPYSRTDIRR